MTARHQAQLEIEDRRREVWHLARVSVLGQLSGAFAHELNQPLAAILSNAEAARYLLHRHPLDAEQLLAIVHDIIADDRRASAMILRLHGLLKQGDRRLEGIDVQELVDEIMTLSRTELITRQVTGKAVVAPHLPTLFGDKVQLEQVLLNLILNACEAMSATPPSGRCLEVIARTGEGGQLYLAVRDTGTGIPPALIDRLFEPFVTTKPDGLGLGLSISRTIVAAHAGRIWAENNPGGGATVHCLLPVRASHDAAGVIALDVVRNEETAPLGC